MFIVNDGFGFVAFAGKVFATEAEAQAAIERRVERMILAGELLDDMVPDEIESYEIIPLDEITLAVYGVRA